MTQLLPAILSALLLVTVLFLLLPELGARGLRFSVLIDPAYLRGIEYRRLIARYRASVAATGAVCLGLAAIWPWRIGLLVLAQLVVVTALYFWGFRQVRQHALPPPTTRTASLAPEKESLPGGWAVQAGPFLLCALAALWLWLYRDALPERFASHWNLQGKPDGWMTRAGAFKLPLFPAGLCASLTALSLAILRFSPRGPIRRVTASALLGTEYLVALLFTGLAVASATASQSQSQGMPASIAILVGGSMLATSGLVLVVALVLNKKAREAPPPPSLLSLSHRKAGFFYADRDDPALFVERRFGLGYTLNFGHPWAWPLLALMLVAPLALALLLLR